MVFACLSKLQFGDCMTIVVVDDSSLIRKIIINNLLKLGIEERAIKEAQDGQQALEFLTRLKKVDLLITDLMMPKLDGIELIKSISKNSKLQKCVVVVISGSISNATKKRLDSLGVYGSIPKPFDKDKFMEVLEPAISAIRQGVVAERESRLEMQELFEIAGKEIIESRIEESELVLDYGDKEIRIDAERLLQIARVVNIDRTAEAEVQKQKETEERLRVS